MNTSLTLLMQSVSHLVMQVDMTWQKHVQHVEVLSLSYKNHTSVPSHLCYPTSTSSATYEILPNRREATDTRHSQSKNDAAHRKDLPQPAV